MLGIVESEMKGRESNMDLKIFTDNIEEEALNQINTLLFQDAFKECKVRIMPDVHAGAGCVIGFTADLGDKVIPNIVGVDIGCGMLTVELGNIDIDFDRLDRAIRDKVPSGRNVHEGRICRFDLTDLKCFQELKDTKRLERSIGTLGGGNHFIEVDIDDEDNKYLVIHTGSRNLGKQVAEYYQQLAIELMSGKDKLLEKQNALIKQYKADGRKSEIQNAIKKLHREFSATTPDIPKDLCYLTGSHRRDYLHDMEICQRFAVVNRNAIASTLIDSMGLDSKGAFETIHNYIDINSNIVRKGAISAKSGERLLIPINMRDGCILGTGKGNDDWNQSAPHGAGRIMSRMKARQSLDMVDYIHSMDGIYTTSVTRETIDEAPMAYKSIDEIVKHIEPTVRIDKIIKPVYNFKGH
ncbi:MAG: RtcB family protein [Lachnospiraceae bacterium]|nr:RtcB family protein [Lachnospiraceae bacterium]